MRAVCAKHAIHYHEPSFLQANVETIQALQAAAAVARKATKDPTHGFYTSALWDAMNAVG